MEYIEYLDSLVAIVLGIILILQNIDKVKEIIFGKEDIKRKLQKATNEKPAFYVENRIEGHKLIGTFFEDLKKETEIYGIFNNLTLPNEVKAEIERSINKCQTFKVLMDCEGNDERIKWLLDSDSVGDIVEIRDFRSPISDGSDLPKTPGDIRMLIRSEGYWCAIGIIEPVNHEYYGIFVKNGDLYRFLRLLFLNLYSKYSLYNNFE